MNTTKRHYETLYVVDSTLTDEQVDSIIEKYSGVITAQGGELIAAGRWDKRRLAYEIKGRREGTYILTYFIGEPEVSKELDRLFRIADDVFRHIIVRVEPQHIDTSRLDRAAQAPEAEAAAPEAAPAAAPAETAGAAEAQPEAAEAPAAAAEPAAEQPAAEEPKAETESE